MIITRGLGENQLLITRGYGTIIPAILVIPTYIFKRVIIQRLFKRVRLR